MIPVGKSSLLGVDIVPMRECIHTAVAYQELHAKLGHPNDAKVKATAKHLGIKYTGTPHTCEDCAEAKIRMKNISKETTHEVARYRGERIMIDISSVQEVSRGGNKFWLLIMDEFTGYCWSIVLRNKSELSKTMLHWIKNFNKEHKTKVKYIRCDNAGENHKFMKDTKEHLDYYVRFEFTAPNTPQQNGRGKVRSMMMNSAQFPQRMRYDLWAHAAKLAT